MIQSISGVLAYSLVPVVAAAGGSAWAAIKPPGAKLRSAIQHFAAGVVFSVVSVELLPDVVREHRPLWVAIGFAGGIVTMLALRWITENKLEAAGARQFNRIPTTMLLATGIDIVLDGLLVGIGFGAGEKEGKLLVAALALELFSLTTATTATLINAGTSQARSALAGVLFAFGIPVGAIAGITLLHNTSEAAMEGFLSFGLAALLFLVTEELLVEAHEVPETPAITASFFAGFLIFMILGMVA